MFCLPALQTTDLRKEFDDLKKWLNKDTVEFALRDVKEYATRSNDVNVDTLQMKLMHLDEVGRRTQHDDRELYSKVLERFIFHKTLKKVGLLVSTLLSTSTDARLYDKEHKFLKLHGGDKEKEDAEKPKKSEVDHSSKIDWQMMYMQLLQQYSQPRFPVPSPPPFRPPPMFRRTPQARLRFHAYTGCHYCGELSYFKVDRPKLK